MPDVATDEDGSMQPFQSAWNWLLLLLLGVSSYMVESGFGYVFPFIFTEPATNPDSALPTAFPWGAGLFFSAQTAIVFLFCLRDPHQRRAAFAAFGISALLTGPFYVLNVNRLAQVVPVSPGMLAHLSMVLTALCWIFSLGLLLWWLFRSIPVTRQGPVAPFLFAGLLLVLLIMPALSSRCGIESLSFFTLLPTNADAYKDDQAALTHLLVFGFAGTLGDEVTFMTQWIGLVGSILILPVVVYVVRAGLCETRKQPTSTDAFPSRGDLVPILCLAVGGFLFAAVSSTMSGLIDQMNGVATTVQRPFYPCYAGLFSVQILVELVFLAGGWLVLRRIWKAPHIRFGFGFLILIASLLLSMLCILITPHAMKTGGVLALILCVAQGIVFFHPRRRVSWIPSVFNDPSGISLSFAIRGSVLLALLASAFMAIALELAMVSVMAIHYLIAWGTALKLPHGVAPIGEIAPAFAPSLAAINITLGPVYFSACVFFGVLLTIVFSMSYLGCRVVAKLYRRARGFKPLEMTGS